MFRVLLFALVAIITGCSAYAWWLMQRALPIIDGSICLEHLNKSGVIQFDEREVPYIEANNERDLWLLQGYATAAERMFQMDVLRRSALGELAEVFGSSCLPQDKLMRTIGINRIAEEEVKNLPQDVRANLQAYCLGVNSYITQNKEKLPIEFVLLGYKPRLWELRDTIAILKHYQYELDESWRLDDLQQRIFDKVGVKIASQLFLRSSLKKSASTVHAQKDLISKLHELLNSSHIKTNPRPMWGSNAWAVSAMMSDSKNCLLACDKHSAFTSPDQWFLCSLSSPTTHVAGATIPGVPGVVVGRNNYIGWGNVRLRADVQDLFLEQFSTQFPNKYRTAGGWQNIGEITEEIPVRFANFFSDKKVIEKVQTTKHGPILVKNNTTAVALSWTGINEKRSALESIWKLNHATNWEDFNDALKDYYGPVQTFIYADCKGNIGFHVAGDVPIKSGKARNQYSAGAVLLPGWVSNFEWLSTMSFDELPQAFNPRQDFCVALDQNLAGCLTINNTNPGVRITNVLWGYKKSGQKLGLPEMATLQGDQYAKLGRLICKQLHQSIGRTEIIDRYQLSALKLIDSWDDNLSPTSSAAAIYESLLMTITKRLVIPKLGPELAKEYLERWPQWSSFVEQVLEQKPIEWLPPEERTYETFILTSFSEALSNLRLALHNDDPKKWLWQDLHKARFRNMLYDKNASVFVSILSYLFNIGSLPVGGDQDCVNASNIVPSNNRFQFECDSGPTLRMLFDMSDQDKLYANLVLGQSGHLLSSHRTDQLKSWLHLEPHVLAFSSAQLDKQMQHKLLLNNH